MLKLRQLFEVCMKKFSDKAEGSVSLQKETAHSALELRIDDKGFVYSKHRKADKMPLNDEEFAQFCQMTACIALMEMREIDRVLH
jgi:hypothetical protein